MIEAKSEAGFPRDGLATTMIRPGGPGLGESIREILSYHELLQALVVRNIASRYAQTMFGALWVLFQPLMQVGLYWLVFGLFVPVPTGNIPYVLMALSGLLVWMVFAQGMERASTSLVQDERLVTKVYFPRLLLPMAAILSVLVDYLLGMVVLVPLAWWLGFPPAANLLLLVPSCAMALLAAYAFGSCFAALNIRWRDLRQVTPFMVQTLVWATPVAYPMASVPEKWQAVILCNPMAPVVMISRHAVLGTGLPPTWSILLSASVLIGLTIVSTTVFRKVEGAFADYI